jgi:CubicO group peptidase (beta-lactamase class C family)
MTVTSTRFADFEKRANRAVGHVKIGSAYEHKFQRRPDAQAPAGGVSSSVHDMARWLAMVAQGGKVEGRPFIDGKTLLAAMSVQVVSSPAATFTARPGFYGYGFNVGVTAAGRMSFSHSGGFDLGAATNFVILPSAGIGIVVLTNAAPIGAAETLAAEFMDLVQFGKIEHEWFKLYSAAFAAMSAPIGSLVGKQGPEKPKPAITLAAYAGNYVSDYYGAAQVVRTDDGLVLKLGPKGDVEYPLRHWDGNQFIFMPSSENSPEGSISLATFKTPRNARFGELTIEYLDQQGLGTFQRK